MRILVADFAGHPFQYELSNGLARNGHDVSHSYCASLLTPQAAFDDELGAEVHPIDLGHPFEKYSPPRRLRDELLYGIRTARLVRRTSSEVLLTSNTPVFSLLVLWLTCRILRIRWVLWLQDVQAGLAAVVRGKPDLITRMLSSLERFLIRRADHVVTISPEFKRAVLDMGARPERVTTIENWAPLDELPVKPKDNDWSSEHDLSNSFVFLYSGTLGKKHSPHLLVALADAFSSYPDVKIVVVAQGTGADDLAETPRPNLIQLPFQPFEDLPDVLATADVLIALLEPGAGGFSVPSKTLTYLCAERAILASIPGENAAARLIADRARAGLVVPSDDSAHFVDAARTLRTEPEARSKFAQSARRFAEDTFDITQIVEKFESVLSAEGN